MNESFNHHVIGHVEQISIESDEHGFELHILTSDEGRIAFNIQAVAVDLYRAVIDTIGPWISEALEARASYVPPIDADAYDPLDPKHPDFLANADAIRDRMRSK